MAKKKPAARPKKKAAKQAKPAKRADFPPLPRIITDEVLLLAIKECRGLIYAIAQMVDCSEQTVRNRAKQNPKLLEAIKHERGHLGDKAERNVYDAVEKGNVDVSKWVIERLRKNKFSLRNETRIGEDKKAPLQSSTKIAIEELPLALRIQLLDELMKKKKRIEEGAPEDNKEEPEPEDKPSE